MFLIIFIILLLTFLDRKIFSRSKTSWTVFDTVEEITKRKIPLESHVVYTPDGYILEIFRMYLNYPPTGEAVLFQHGFLSSSTDWVIVEGSIPFLLAEKGWDVWLGNHRGNAYSKTHLSLPTTSKAYWDFSYHDLGLLDLPAVINYIKRTTQRDKIVYIGHSQGCSGFLAMASLLPEMNDKVLAMIALAPVAALSHSKTRFPILYKMGLFLNLPKYLMEKVGVYKLGGYNLSEILPWINIISYVFHVVGELIGRQIMAANTHYPSQIVKCNSFKYFVLHRLQNAASWKQISHFNQSLSGKLYFHQYDYGPVENLVAYGTKSPPMYNLKRITTHVSLIWGEHDSLVVPLDLIKLYNKLQNKTIIHISKYRHLDFIASTKHNDIIVDHIVSVCNKLRNSK